MNFFRILYFTLLNVIISNVIIVYTSNELARYTENHTSVTIDDLKKLIRRYPAFIQLPLQKQDYYNGKDVPRCPMPYNENTITDDPDVVEDEFFNPRECLRPWTWTYKNYIDVSVPINGTVDQKLGNIIQPCLKGNGNIIQCYTHYLNVMESVGLTLVDRFCLFMLEVFNRLEQSDGNVDYMDDFSLFDITVNIPALNLIIKNFRFLWPLIYFAFKQYYISTLPLDCVAIVLDKFTSSIYEYNTPFEGYDVDEFYKKIHNCRELTMPKRNYAVLESDQYWQWDTNTDGKPDDNLIILTQFANNELGSKLFNYNKLK